MNVFSSPHISIALATHNGEKFLREQLESVLNQSLKPTEIIVCDDQSSDQTVEILKEYQRDGKLKFSVNEKRLGAIKNFQKAINLCSGSYIALCDQDDVWHANKLQSCLTKMKMIEDDSLPCLVYSDLEIVDDHLVCIEKSFWKYLRVHPTHETFRSLLYGNVVTGCTTFFNQAFKKYIELMPSEAAMHDQWIGLIAYGLGKVGVVPEATVKYRRHQSTLTDVEALSAFGRINRAMSLAAKEFKTNSFLETEFFQAELFYKTYASFLSDEKKQDISDFLKERNRSYLNRKIKKILAKRFNRFLF